MCSPEFTTEQRQTLLDLAEDSVRHGLQHGAPLPVDLNDYPEALWAERASFVTLHKNGQLRGCIGHLTPVAPLLKDIADNAFAAAFRDPRFAAVQQTELPQLEFHLSILSPAEPIPFDDETDLLQKLRPGIDGLILETNQGQRGTFLPSVWEQLPNPAEFIHHLKLKAGLNASHPLHSVRISRYTTESFS